MNPDVSSLFIGPDESIHKVITNIDRDGRGVAIVVDEESLLLGIITDGDIRRAILADTALDLSVSTLLESTSKKEYPSPVTAAQGIRAEELLVMMNQYSLQHIPIVDERQRVVDVVLLSDLVSDYPVKWKL